MSMKKPARQMQNVKFSEIAEKIEGVNRIITGKDIERLVDSKPFYHSGHESDAFDATDFDELNAGKYAGIVDLSGNVYIIYYHIDNELLLIHMSDDQIINKIEAYKSDEVWTKRKYEFAMANEGDLTSGLLVASLLDGPTQIPNDTIVSACNGSYAGILDIDTGAVYSVAYYIADAVFVLHQNINGELHEYVYQINEDSKWEYTAENIYSTGTKLYRHTIVQTSSPNVTLKIVANFSDPLSVITGSSGTGLGIDASTNMTDKFISLNAVQMQGGSYTRAAHTFDTTSAGGTIIVVYDFPGNNRLPFGTLTDTVTEL